MRNRNIKTSLTLAVTLPMVVLSGCARTTPNPNLPSGQAAYDVIPINVAPDPDYIIRPSDVLTIRVFREPDLSTDSTQVNENGRIQLPLLGSLDASGKTVNELSELIKQRLGVRYLVDPQVTVSVKQVAPRYATVEGEVQQPGVYEVEANTTLLTLIARARSPTNTAKLTETVVFRTINNQRMVARFNLKDIRTGVSPDPHIIEGDLVMVGYSSSKGLLDSILRAAPLFNIFSRYTL